MLCRAEGVVIEDCNDERVVRQSLPRFQTLTIHLPVGLLDEAELAWINLLQQNSSFT